MGTFEYTNTSDDGEAALRIDPSERGATVNPDLYAKFGEHLSTPWNVKNAFSAETLYNPAFGSWKFQVPEPTVDGGRPPEHDPEEVEERIDHYAEFQALPDAERLHDAYREGCALFWFPVGDIRASPETGVADDRAQRVETEEAGQGVAQWTHLPLQRERRYEGDLIARAKTESTVEVALHRTESDGTLGEPLAEATVTVGTEWTEGTFAFDVPEDVAEDATVALALTTTEAANVVLDRAALRPTDHVAGTDRDVVELCREAELPALRWPGGNFVSGYDWRDGVGPLSERPTKPNPAWDGLEPNDVGTNEFLAFCEAVGCEPIICVNAGDGTAEAAAKWVEYCNGSTDTEMGQLRAEHGHPEPWNVERWELGNEVYGPWQTRWTTATGYADRFERFREAMTAVDDSIEVLACGNRNVGWNDELLANAEPTPEHLTDHILVATYVGAETSREELYNAHMGLATQLGERYRDLEARMEAAGAEEPRLSVTELQLFTRFEETDAEPTEDGTPVSASNIPGNKSITEALYDATVIHESARMAPFLDAVTHSGLGNHGGGVRKHKESVWADPCYYGHRMGAALAGGTQLGVELACDSFSTDRTFGTDDSKWLGEIEPVDGVPSVDALAVETEGDIVAMLVHRDATAGGVTVDIEVGDGFEPGSEAALTELTADAMEAENSYEEPERVTPTESTAPVEDGTLSVTLSPNTLLKVRFAGE